MATKSFLKRYKVSPKDAKRSNWRESPRKGQLPRWLDSTAQKTFYFSQAYVKTRRINYRDSLSQNYTLLIEANI